MLAGGVGGLSFANPPNGSGKSNDQARQRAARSLRHVEDVRSARGVQHVRPIEETRERLAITAVANEAQTARWGDVACDAAHAAAPTPKRKVQGHVSLTSGGLLPRVRVFA